MATKDTSKPRFVARVARGLAPLVVACLSKGDVMRHLQKQVGKHAQQCLHWTARSRADFIDCF